MTDIKNILAKYGLTVAADKLTEFEKDFRENYKSVAEVNKTVTKLETERDNYKTQYDTAATALKEFEGVDVKELKDKVATLTTDLANKDNEFKTKLADMEFDSWLDGQLSNAKAKNVTAVKALFDIKALKESKNRDADFTAKLESVKTENGYLFDDGNNPAITVPGQPAPTPSSDKAYMDAFYKNNPFYPQKS